MRPLGFKRYNNKSTIKLANKNNWTLWDLHQDDVKLEDVFKHLTAESARKRGS